MHTIQDSDGRFLVRLKIENNAGLTADDFGAIVEERLRKVSLNMTVNNVTIGTVGRLYQAQNIYETSGSEGTEKRGTDAMAQFNNTMGDVQNLYQADQITINHESATKLGDIVANKQPEKPGFTDQMKDEVVTALKSIALDQAKALPKNIYMLLKEFFPSYIKPFLP